LPPTFEPDTVTFEVPAEEIFDFDAMFRDDFCQPQPPNLDPLVSYDPFPAGPIVYKAPFLEPFTGRSYDHSYITRESVAESFAFESVPSHNDPLVYSAFPDGKASGQLISGLLEQQNKIQNEYALYQPISY
jgi:hypothetical protein